MITIIANIVLDNNTTILSYKLINNLLYYDDSNPNRELRLYISTKALK